MILRRVYDGMAIYNYNAMIPMATTVMAMAVTGLLRAMVMRRCRYDAEDAMMQ